MRALRVISVWTLVVFVLISGLAVGGWVLIKGGVDQQNKTLLQNDESQLVLVLHTAAQNLETELRGVAFYTMNAGGSPQAFAAQAKRLMSGPKTSVALVDVSGSSQNVLLANGPTIRPGQPLPAPIAAVAKAAPVQLTSAVVHVGSVAYLVLASTDPVYPHDVAIETTELNQTSATPNRSGPYTHLFVNVYGTPNASPNQLIVTTFGPGALPAPIATAVVRYGAINWLVQASPRSSLVGAYASATPWIALGVGLVVAFALAVAVEALSRRERHAARVVAEKTGELLDAQKLLIRNERLAAVGEMAAVIGHELRNPLSSAINEIFLARTMRDDSQIHLTRAERAVYRAARLSEDLTAYMREREPVFTDIDFETLVSEVFESVPAPSEVEVAVDGSTHLWADQTLIAQALTNVVTNAYQAMPRGGNLEVSAAHEDHSTVITVQDSGSGVDPAVAERLFDPFFTTKEDGTGLGLAIVRRLVELQGGSVDIENGHLGGATVSVRLPVGNGPR